METLPVPRATNNSQKACKSIKSQATFDATGQEGHFRCTISRAEKKRLMMREHCGKNGAGQKVNAFLIRLCHILWSHVDHGSLLNWFIFCIDCEMDMNQNTAPLLHCFWFQVVPTFVAANEILLDYAQITLV